MNKLKFKITFLVIVGVLTLHVCSIKFLRKKSIIKPSDMDPKINRYIEDIDNWTFGSRIYSLDHLSEYCTVNIKLFTSNNGLISEETGYILKTPKNKQEDLLVSIINGRILVCFLEEKANSLIDYQIDKEYLNLFGSTKSWGWLENQSELEEGAAIFSYYSNDDQNLRVADVTIEELTSNNIQLENGFLILIFTENESLERDE